MPNYKEEFKRWRAQKPEDPQLAQELKAIASDATEQENRFSTELEFGTAGMRGLLGAGTNRMNIYTVRRATQGVADYINERFGGGSVAISYDSRINSELFARESAAVLAANGITAYIYRTLNPVPVLSFTTRELSCRVGIMITASHNPSNYNGYKVYGADGCQLTPEDAEAVLVRINAVDIFEGVKTVNFDEGIRSGLIKYVSENVFKRYCAAVMGQSVSARICAKSGLKVVYTPLNGAGNIPVRTVLNAIGIDNIFVVPEQEQPDGNFPTCPSPNPEFTETYKLAFELAQGVKPDIIIATDPDADRLGVALPDNEGYRVLTGNEIGVLLLDYICRARTEKKTMPERAVAVKSVVSTDLAERIALRYGVSLINVLPGFKFIGEQILMLEQKNELSRFIFGFEESNGYLAGTYARDKDAVVAAMLMCEAVCYYRTKGKTAASALEEIYEQNGYFLHEVLNFTEEGIAGRKRISDTMQRLREEPPRTIADMDVERFYDYGERIVTVFDSGEREPIALPRSDMLVFAFRDGASVIVRPSGTEPKIKVYVNAVGDSREQSEALRALLSDAMKKLIAL